MLNTFSSPVQYIPAVASCIARIRIRNLFHNQNIETENWNLKLRNIFPVNYITELFNSIFQTQIPNYDRELAMELKFRPIVILN